METCLYCSLLSFTSLPTTFVFDTYLSKLGKHNKIKYKVVKFSSLQVKPEGHSLDLTRLQKIFSPILGIGSYGISECHRIFYDKTRKFKTRSRGKTPVYLHSVYLLWELLYFLRVGCFSCYRYFRRQYPKSIGKHSWLTDSLALSFSCILKYGQPYNIGIS